METEEEHPPAFSLPEDQQTQPLKGVHHLVAIVGYKQHSVSPWLLPQMNTAQTKVFRYLVDSK